jgi:hypothetical protein
MPERIDMTIYWSNENSSMSFYTMYTSEIEDMIMNYYFDQALLFTFVDPQIIYEWIWDVFAREPKEIIIDTIKY